MKELLEQVWNMPSEQLIHEINSALLHALGMIGGIFCLFALGWFGYSLYCRLIKK